MGRKALGRKTLVRKTLGRKTLVRKTRASRRPALGRVHANCPDCLANAEQPGVYSLEAIARTWYYYPKGDQAEYMKVNRRQFPIATQVCRLVFHARHLKHFKALLAPQPFQSFANTSNISKPC